MKNHELNNHKPFHGFQEKKIKSFYGISIYDPNNGIIRHMHRVVFFEGAEEYQPDVIEKDAISHAKRLGHDMKSLKVLHTPDLNDYQSDYTVDIKNQRLVKLPKPSLSDRRNL